MRVRWGAATAILPPAISLLLLIGVIYGMGSCMAALPQPYRVHGPWVVETVPERYKPVRHDSSWTRSLAVLAMARERKQEYRVGIKSGMMLGLGETREQLISAMGGLLKAGCEILTLGQYLQPTRRHLPVHRFVPPDEFEEWRKVALDLGFAEVASGPFVRSSYRAEAFYLGARPVPIES